MSDWGTTITPTATRPGKFKIQPLYHQHYQESDPQHSYLQHSHGQQPSLANLAHQQVLPVEYPVADPVEYSDGAADALQTPNYANCIQDLMLTTGENATFELPDLGVSTFPVTEAFMPTQQLLIPADANANRGTAVPRELQVTGSNSPQMIGGAPPLPILNKRTRSLPIKEWILTHILNPYPTQAEYIQLATQTGLSLDQVGRSLSNYRRRLKVKTVEASEWNSLKSWTAVDSPTSIPGSARFPLDSRTPTMPQSLSTFNAANLAASHRYPGDVTPTYLHNLELASQGNGASREKTTLSNGAGGRTHDYSRRKGKKRRLSAHTTTPPTSEDFGPVQNATAKKGKSYPCTVPSCNRTFKEAYGWRRHESAVHQFHSTEWVCMLNGYITDGTCAFCTEYSPDPTHVHEHNISTCREKTEPERTFYREDGLKQHAKFVHLADLSSVDKTKFRIPEEWTRHVPTVSAHPDSLWCGFCQEQFLSTAERMDHVAAHFSEGRSLRDWQRRRSLSR